MSNTSKKHRNRKVTRYSIAILIILLVGSYIVSNSDSNIDPEKFAHVEVSAIEPRIKGNVESELTLVEYSDFQCPACKQAYPIVKDLIENYGDQFSFEYRHFPLRSIHPNAQSAAIAAESAGIQGKFWEMHDLLFENQEKWSRSINPKKNFVKYAEELGLNVDRFKYDLASKETKAEVDAEVAQANVLKISGTPGFVVNGVVSTLAEFSAMLDMESTEG